MTTKSSSDKKSVIINRISREKRIVQNAVYILNVRNVKKGQIHPLVRAFTDRQDIQGDKLRV